MSTVASFASVGGSHSGETAHRISTSLQVISGNLFDTHREAVVPMGVSMANQLRPLKSARQSDDQPG